MIASKVDWGTIRFVVFDVDGTLYNQRRLRLRMAGELLADAVARGSLINLRVLRAYRFLREAIGEEEIDDFQTSLMARIVALTGQPAEKIEAVVSEWIGRRPLAYIASCRYDGLVELFAGLRRQNKAIGIYSDYPADEKLQRMTLSADYVLAASDPGVGILKPHPRGLQMLMQRAGVGPAQTVLIGDRPERDGLAARRAGVLPLIRSDGAREGWLTFSTYSDPVFAALRAEEAFG
ncbi:HAD-IA family hydrolase [Rhizobium leguminosarum bv. viciae]|jgi:FMN phosphatase YigB (HAD superfamily)|uniref:phosphoglycolate phosphatase n=1 Tax=Rhizobium leguminosarum bv. viciae TaxID=387 RepID=A0A8I2GVA6_RHILV|nr:HAD family hydrolase [Rhizobium leguminosarum]ASR11794.1 HAD family hydrolase [Rhizobium leguminosarum bv. viciae]MBY5752692.1 HAD family hydrolase [Rhizobium leguminosarum]MBY5770121.1 HAD family hydrolase [Rhizobium leguminosarum]MBY5824515.1 HAD family hydrolase [Rhizobium leguminosarum]NKM47185.1 HAD-IA family hydrolase [Rhizobium leguminosarum bv. viciae]